MKDSYNYLGHVTLVVMLVLAIGSFIVRTHEAYQLERRVHLLTDQLTTTESINQEYIKRAYVNR